jgi:hypothetical protein
MTQPYVPAGYALTPELSQERVTKFAAPGRRSSPASATRP